MSPSHAQKLSRHLLRQAVDILPTAILVADAQSRDRPILFANGAAARLWGLTTAELVGRSLNTLMAGEPGEGPGGSWPFRAASGGDLYLLASPLYTSPGVPACWLLTPVEASGSSGVAGSLRDRTTEQRLPAGGPEAPEGGPDSQARPVPASPRSFDPGATGTFSVTDSWIRMRDERNDPATGVLCRESFLDLLTRDLAVANRSDRSISVMHFRVEALESYQGLFGRHATDACLRKVAHAISTNLRRGSDCCGRTGQDAFTVLSHGGDPATTAEFAARIAQRVRDLAIHHPRSGNGRYVTVTWGLVVSGGNRAQDDVAIMAAAELDLERRTRQAADKPADKGPERGSAAGSA